MNETRGPNRSGASLLALALAAALAFAAVPCAGRDLADRISPEFQKHLASLREG